MKSQNKTLVTSLKQGSAVDVEEAIIMVMSREIECATYFDTIQGSTLIFKSACPVGQVTLLFYLSYQNCTCPTH